MDDIDPDAALVERIGRGDEAAARLFVAAKLSRIAGLAMRMLHDRAEAEDVVQEAFVRGWRQTPRWRPALRIAGSELPRAERQAFRAALHDVRRSIRPVLAEARAERTRAVSLLRQPALDQPATLNASARARAADATMRAAVEMRAVAFTATLSAADRARLADAMEERAQRPRRTR